MTAVHEGAASLRLNLYAELRLHQVHLDMRLPELRTQARLCYLQSQKAWHDMSLKRKRKAVHLFCLPTNSQQICNQPPAMRVRNVWPPESGADLRPAAERAQQSAEVT